MDRALKQRLLGATILVAIVVLVVPALLTGPRDTTGQEPAPAPGLRSVEIEIGEAASGAEAPPADPAVEPEPEPESEAMAPAAAPPPDPAPEGRATQPSRPGDSGAASLPRAASTPPVAPPVPEPAGAPAPVPVPDGTGFAVQVAALSKPEAARELADTLKGQGYRAFVMEYRADGKLFYRVRVGPEPSRENADVLARRLAADSHKAVVVRHP